MNTYNVMKNSCRRSRRLKLKEVAHVNSQSVIHSTIGYFEILPIEVVHFVFNNLSVTELSLLTVASKSMRDLVEGYRFTGAGLRKLLPKPLPHNTVSAELQLRYVNHFKHLGLLMKRSTCLFSTRDRLKIIEDFLKKLDCISNSGCQNLSSCVSLNCYGQFIHTIIAGWDPLECHRAFSTIASCSNILTTMGACISAKPGAKSHDEIYIRIFLHRVLLDWSDGDDKTFWLSRILKPWPMVQQARILYILYGPKCPHSDAILWYEMTDSTPGSSATSLTTQLAELALALKMLYNCKEWSEDDIISVIEELTALPDEWVTENVSKLLMLCGDTICIKVMGSKVINGHYQELSQLIVSLSVVTTKEQYSMSWVIKLVRRLLGITESLKEQKILLATIAETFKEIIFDIYEYNDEETDLSFQYVLDAQAEFNKEVMSLAFLEKEQN
ncbi:F-box only protein 47-like [Saccoglossus kowalevskii]